MRPVVGAVLFLSIRTAFAFMHASVKPVLVQEQQRVEPSGCNERALAAFPDQHMVRRVHRRQWQSRVETADTTSLLEAKVLSNFCNVWLAKHADLDHSIASSPASAPRVEPSGWPRPLQRPAPRAVLSCSATSEDPALSEAQLDGWRAFRRQLMEGGCPRRDARAMPLFDGADGEAWAHELPHLERGCLLVCEPGTRFNSREHEPLEHSVLLLIEHGPCGSVAIALNQQPLGTRGGGGAPSYHADTRLGGTDGDDGGIWLLAIEGAPRDGPSVASAAHASDHGLDHTSERRPPAAAEEADRLLPGLWLRRLRAHQAPRTDSMSPPLHFFYAGHYEWEAGELQDEVEAGVWRCVAASTAALTEVLLDEHAALELKHRAVLQWVDGKCGTCEESAAQHAEDRLAEEEEEWAAVVESWSKPAGGSEGQAKRQGGGDDTCPAMVNDTKYANSSESARLRVMRRREGRDGDHGMDHD